MEEGQPDFVGNREAHAEVKRDVVWHLGEAGHPNAWPLIRGAKGVPGKAKKAVHLKNEDS